MRYLIIHSPGRPVSLGGLLVLFICTGCGESARGPNLHPVSGTITLDGTALSDASVVFTPQGGGRSLYAVTDDDGDYELGYSTNSAGAPPGAYVVSIKTGRVDEDDPDTGGVLPPTPERVPAVYNVRSTLVVHVPADADAYSFALESNASDIVQPVPEPQ